MAATDPQQQPTLKRSLSLSLVTFYGLGNILGAGIYVLIGTVAGHAGYQTPLSFLLASLLAGFTAFSYAELASRFPVSAGAVVYIQNGIGIRALSILVGLLVIMTGVVSAATIARGFTGYLAVFYEMPDAPAIVALLLVLGALCAWGITESVRVAALMTLAEAAGLLLIIWVAKPSADQAVQALHHLAVWPEGMSAAGIFLGAFLAFYAFIGFEDMVNVAEEVHHPERNLPLAILLALGISTLLYFAVAFVAVSTADPRALAASDAPLAWLYRHATGAEPGLITGISLVAVVNGALIQIIMASRVCYGMGRKGLAPAWLSRIHPVTRTPVIATVLITALVIAMALWLPIEALARTTNFFMLTVFTLVNIALWRIKRRADYHYEGFSVYRWVPVAGALGSLGFIAAQLSATLGSGA